MGIWPVSVKLCNAYHQQLWQLLTEYLVGSDTGLQCYMCKMIMNPPPLNWNHAKTEESILPLSAGC